MGIIYRYISPSGKSYIGQTKRDKSIRHKEHLYYYSKFLKSDESGGTWKGCRALYTAFKKYNPESFKCEILLECNDKDLNMFETKMIFAYNSLVPNGYNLTSGGGVGMMISDDTKRKRCLTAEKTFICIEIIMINFMKCRCM